LGRGPATLSHKNQLATETTSVTNAIWDRTSATCDIRDESFLPWGEATMTAPGESRNFVALCSTHEGAKRISE